MQSGFRVTSTQATGLEFDQGATLTITGTQVVNGQTQAIFQFDGQDLRVHATNLSGAEETVTTSDGRQLVFGITSLNYSLFGIWSVTPSSVGDPQNSTSTAIFLSGYQTSTSGVPTGSATYSGNGTNGGVVGLVLAPSGTGTIGAGALQGQATIAVNFSTGAVAGSLTGMTVTPVNGTAAAWNNVSLSGSLSGSNLSGTTGSTGTPPTGAMSFDGSSTGTFKGALFGPSGQELGAIWTLYDSTGQGKSAVGVLGATKQ